MQELTAGSMDQRRKGFNRLFRMAVPPTVLRTEVAYAVRLRAAGFPSGLMTAVTVSALAIWAHGIHEVP